MIRFFVALVCAAMVPGCIVSDTEKPWSPCVTSCMKSMRLCTRAPPNQCKGARPKCEAECGEVSP